MAQKSIPMINWQLLSSIGIILQYKQTVIQLRNHLEMEQNLRENNQNLQQLYSINNIIQLILSLIINN